MRSIFTIAFFFLALTGLRATHIVGGDFYYEYLSGDKYRITLKLYVDCENGSKVAIESDSTGIIGIFGANDNQLIRTYERRRTGPIHLNGVLYKCIVKPGNVCVDQYNYVYDIDLPKRSGGYIIAFQRCCRNNTIRNIMNAEGTGATYWVQVPDRDIVNTDNSPIFKKFPPIYVCKDFPLVFDHSASDKDYDSLSYELYQPFAGGDPRNSRPDPPNDPPFDNVQWAGYSTGNQMGGNPILEINETTGELTVTPNTLGQFVIGVKVKEWRNGVLIGETLRDYQFNVVDCHAITVAIFKSLVQCSDTVSFTDKSIGATSISWDFGDPNSGIDKNTSNAKNPTHIYTANGDYTVTLKAWNPACQDEYSMKVKVRTQKGFTIGKDRVFCTPIKNVISVPFTDYTSIDWSTGSKSAFITISNPGKYWVTARYGNCPPMSDTINIGYNPVSFDRIPDSLFCDKVDIDLEVKNRSPKAKILWPGGDTSSTLHVGKEGKYIVRIYNANCEKFDTVNLTTAKITPDLGPDIFRCNSFVETLDAGLQPPGTEYLWNDGTNAQTITTSNPGKYWVTTTLKHCTKSDTILVSNSKVVLEIGPDKHFCDSVRILLDAGPPNGSATLYAWSNGEITRQATITNTGKHWVTKTDNFGCQNSDTINFNMTLSPVIDIGKDTVVICLRSPIRLFAPSGYTSYEWENGSGTNERFVEEGGKYRLTVMDEAGCTGSDSIIVKTNPNLLPNNIYIPNAFTPNGDGLNDVFPFEEPVLQTDYNLKIFNRWGEKVYDTNETRNPWDGSARNDDGQLDAYMWTASYKGCDGNRHSDKGTVTILR